MGVWSRLYWPFSSIDDCHFRWGHWELSKEQEIKCKIFIRGKLMVYLVNLCIINKLAYQFFKAFTKLNLASS